MESQNIDCEIHDETGFPGHLDKISWTDDGQLLAVSTQSGIT